MNFIGVDLHSQYDQVAWLDRQGEMHPSQRYEASEREKLILFVRSQAPCTVALEACGGAYALFDQLSSIAERVLIVDGKELRKRFPKKGRKTDTIDAQNLALYASYDGSGIWVPDEKVRLARMVASDRVRLTELQTKSKNVIHARLREYALRKPANVAKDLFSKDGLTWLRSSLAGLPRLVAASIRVELNLIECYEENLKQIDSDIAALAGSNPEIKLMMSVPGVNYWSAFAMNAEIGDAARFQGPKQLTGYAGLVPRIHQSGTRCITGSITKRGRSTLRWMAVECAQTAARYSPKLAALYERVRRRSRLSSKAKVAVGRKLLELIWHILKSGKPYAETNEVMYGKKLRALARQSNLGTTPKRLHTNISGKAT